MTISDPDKIAPNINSSPEIVVLKRSDKQFSSVMIPNPSIIKCIKLTFYTFNQRKISLNKRKLFIQTSCFCLQIVISDIVYCVFYDFSNPLFLYFLLPSLVESLDCNIQIVLLILKILIFP